MSRPLAAPSPEPARERLEGDTTEAQSGAPMQLRAVGEATARLHEKAKRLAEEWRAREARAREAELDARRGEQKALGIAKRAAEQSRDAAQRAGEAEQRLAESRLELEAAIEQAERDLRLAREEIRKELKAKAMVALKRLAADARERFASAEQAKEDA